MTRVCVWSLNVLGFSYHLLFEMCVNTNPILILEYLWVCLRVCVALFEAHAYIYEDRISFVLYDYKEVTETEIVFCMTSSKACPILIRFFLFFCDATVCYATCGYIPLNYSHILTFFESWSVFSRYLPSTHFIRKFVYW